MRIVLELPDDIVKALVQSNNGSALVRCPGCGLAIVVHDPTIDNEHPAMGEMGKAFGIEPA